ncbi:unnamed protein product [Pichia kudriavzevii]
MYNTTTYTSQNAGRRDQLPAEKSQTSTAKRSPSILVTDVRKNQIRAPFAGHKLQQQKSKDERTQDRVSNFVKSMRRSSNSKYSKISISNLTSNISDIPSSRQRELPRFMTNDPLVSRRNSQKIPQYTKNLPSRTSKVTEKLVLIPEQESNHSVDGSREKTTNENIFQEVNKRTKAEKLTKEQREVEYPRVTAYLIAEGFNLKLTSKFLAKNHCVLPRLYDEVLYIPYSLPLLPGENGYRVQSNTSLKMQRGIKLMEQFIDKSEERDHHYEFYSGADHENKDATDIDEIVNSPNQNDFDPSEPQFFVSNSPTDSLLEQEAEESRSDSNGSCKSNISADLKTSSSSDLNHSHKKIDNHEKDDMDKYAHDTKRRNSFKKGLPDLSKHAEMFILDYGVVVFWNFSEIHEKNILADLVFAKIEPGEFDEEEEEEDDDDDDDDDGENDGQEDSDEIYPENNYGGNVENHNDTAVPGVCKPSDSTKCTSESSGDESEEMRQTELSLIIKPVPEHDIETEEFHFEYNKDVPTPRIYNDMITLKSGDHLIKLTMSHAIAQSTKLSLFESKMSGVLNSISRLPKALALTGQLQNYTSKRLLAKTGRLFQLRSEVNLLSNVLDTPEYFWSIEPGLHPLYTAVRDYLEIEQRVEVINDRCKVFLDFFDILSDSLAEKKMTKITKMLILAIGLSVIVSIFEIFVRYLIISKLKST